MVLVRKLVSIKMINLHMLHVMLGIGSSFRRVGAPTRTWIYIANNASCPSLVQTNCRIWKDCQFWQDLSISGKVKYKNCQIQQPYYIFPYGDVCKKQNKTKQNKKKQKKKNAELCKHEKDLIKKKKITVWLFFCREVDIDIIYDNRNWNFWIFW